MQRTSVPPMLPPIDQIAPREWALLLAEGTVAGTVSADDARVMAEVELTEDVIAAVRAGLAQAGISVDEEVELEDVTPTKARRPDAGNGDPLPLVAAAEHVDRVGTVAMAGRRTLCGCT